MIRWFRLVLVVAFYAASIAMFGLFLVWQLDGDPRKTAIRTVVTPNVEQGGDLMLRVAAIMDQTCAVNVRRAIVDSEGTLHLSVPVIDTREAGTAITTIRSTVPSGAAPGPAYYRVTLEWQCNPLQRLWPRIEQLPDLPFTIIEGNTP
jgi:hypothetical protein